MKRKIILITATLLLLVACGDKDSANHEQNLNQEATEEVEVVEEKTEEVEELSGDALVGKTDESELGTRTFIKVKSGINDDYTTGPFIVKIINITISDFVPASEHKDYFSDDVKAAVLVHMEVENTSEDTMIIHPAQSTIVTNTKEQKDADLFLSGDVGGEFIGQVLKKDSIIYFLDSPAEEIDNFKIVIDAPSDSEFTHVGEDLIIEYSFE